MHNWTGFYLDNGLSIIWSKLCAFTFQTIKIQIQKRLLRVMLSYIFHHGSIIKFISIIILFLFCMASECCVTLLKIDSFWNPNKGKENLHTPQEHEVCRRKYDADDLGVCVCVCFEALWRIFLCAVLRYGWLRHKNRKTKKKFLLTFVTWFLYTWVFTKIPFHSVYNLSWMLFNEIKILFIILILKTFIAAEFGLIFLSFKGTF